MKALLRLLVAVIQDKQLLHPSSCQILDVGTVINPIAGRCIALCSTVTERKDDTILITKQVEFTLDDKDKKTNLSNVHKIFQTRKLFVQLTSDGLEHMVDKKQTLPVYKACWTQILPKTSHAGFASVFIQFGSICNRLL